MLISFGGLPGVGKTTIAQAVARRLGAVYLRADVIEMAMGEALDLPDDIGPAGYIVAYAIARSNLLLGLTVVSDCVNDVPVTRAAWRKTAFDAGVACLEVEVVCSDKAEHRRRIETRTVDAPGLDPPDWRAVVQRAYQPWPEAQLVLDTARLDLEAAVARVLKSARSP